MKRYVNSFVSILIVLIIVNTSVYCGEDEFILINAPVIGQFPTLPTGCEVTATAMLLQWEGIEVTKEKLADNIAKGEKPYNYNGVLIGGNPEIEFVGSPYEADSFGAYNAPIYDLINSYLPDRAVDLTGQEFDDVLKFSGENNTPVVVWATINMLPVMYKIEWIEDNTWTTHKWKGNEHSFLLVGYTKDNIIVNDPYLGEMVYYNKEIFKQLWEEMGKKAVSIMPEKEEINETNEVDNEIDELIEKQFNLNTVWRA